MLWGSSCPAVTCAVTSSAQLVVDQLTEDSGTCSWEVLEFTLFHLAEEPAGVFHLPMGERLRQQLALDWLP